MTLLKAGWFQPTWFNDGWWQQDWWLEYDTLSTLSQSLVTTTRTRAHKVKHYNLFEDKTFLSDLIEFLEEL